MTMLQNSISASELNEDYLKNLVNINSQTKNSDGVQDVLYIVQDSLINLGFSVHFVNNPLQISAPLLVANLNSCGRTLGVIGHADTVIPATKSQFRKNGDKLIGAGIADNKAGVFIALRGIERFLEDHPAPNINIQFICSPNEELGSTGFHHFFADLGINLDCVLGFEPAFGEGDLISSRNGNKWYELKVMGKSYHAGRAHKGHINATHDLCRILDHLEKQIYAEPSITMNVGQVASGHSFNTISDLAIAKIDTRFKCFNGLNKIKEIFSQDLSHCLRYCHLENLRSYYEFEIHDYCPPLEFSKKGKNLLSKYRNIISSIEGESFSHVHCGGAADINHFWHINQKGFDGCGAIGGNLHRVDEYVLASSLISRSEAFANFISYYNMGYNESLH